MTRVSTLEEKLPGLEPVQMKGFHAEKGVVALGDCGYTQRV